MTKLLFTFILSILTNCLFSQSSCLLECYVSACDEDKDVENHINKVSDQFLRNDTLSIQIEIVDNCAYASEPLYTDAQYLNDTLYLSYQLKPIITDTLYQDNQIIYELTTAFAECDCCFELMYLLKGMPDGSIPVRLNNSLVE